MRRIALFGFTAILLMVFAGPLQAQDVTGDWTLTYTMMGRGGQSMERSMDITFQQDGSTVTGTTMMQMRRPAGGGAGGNPPAPEEVAIEDGKMEGDQLTFTINRDMGERSFSMTFTGAVAGATMEGTITMSGGRGGGEPAPFKGVKKEG